MVPQGWPPFRRSPGSVSVRRVETTLRTPLILTLALLLLTGVLAGCGDGDATATSIEAATSEPAAPTAEPTSKPSNDSPVADSDSPIEQLLGVPIMDERAMNDYVTEIITEGERRTATCMLAEGFEYTPVLVDGSSLLARGDTTSREFAERIGFGIVAGFDASTSDGQAAGDPNAIYYQSLTEGERSAYEIALNGKERDDPAFSENDGFLDFDGCKGLAAEELLDLFSVLEEFDAPANNIFDMWDADPRVQESRMTWSLCMAEAGYTAQDPEDVRELVFDRMFPVVDNPDAYDVDPDVPQFEADLGVNYDWSELLSGDFYGPHPPLTPAARAELDEVAAFEQGLAVAHFDCYEPLRESDLAVQREYEQVLVDEIGDQVTSRLGD